MSKKRGQILKQRVCGWGRHKIEKGGWVAVVRFGPDASVSAVTLVAIEQQQGLASRFNHWLFTVAIKHVI